MMCGKRSVHCRSKVSQPALHHLVITGERYSAESGKRAGFIHQVAPKGSDITDAARRLGAEPASKGLDRRTLRMVKNDMYRDLCQTLMQPSQFHSHL